MSDDSACLLDYLLSVVAEITLHVTRVKKCCSPTQGGRVLKSELYGRRILEDEFSEAKEISRCSSRSYIDRSALFILITPRLVNRVSANRTNGAANMRNDISAARYCGTLCTDGPPL